MSTPRDRDGDDDPAGEGSGWQRAGAPRATGGEPDPPTAAAAAGRDRRRRSPDRRPAGGPGRPPPRRRAARAGGRRPGGPERLRDERAFRYETDLVGAQGWALQHGWTISDGSGPQDAVLARPDRLRAGAPGQGGTGPAERAARPRRAPSSWSPSTSSIRWAARCVPQVRGDRGAAAGRRPRAAAVPRPVLAAPHRRAASRCRAATTPSTPAGCCSPPRTARRCAGSCRTPPCRACCWAPTTATSSGPAPGTWPRSGPTGTGRS